MKSVESWENVIGQNVIVLNWENLARPVHSDSSWCPCAPVLQVSLQGREAGGSVLTRGSRDLLKGKIRESFLHWPLLRFL